MSYVQCQGVSAKYAAYFIPWPRSVFSCTFTPCLPMIFSLRRRHSLVRRCRSTPTTVHGTVLKWRNSWKVNGSWQRVASSSLNLHAALAI